MSLDYTCCIFLRNTTVDFDAIERIEKRFAVRHTGTRSKYVIGEDGYLDEVPLSRTPPTLAVARRDAYVLAMTEASFTYSYTISFLRSCAPPCIILDISDRNLERMSLALRSHGEKEGFLGYVTMLYVACNAISMALGVDSYLSDLVAFREGRLPAQNIEYNILAAVGCSEASMDVLRTCRGKERSIHGVPVVGRWLPGDT